MAEYSHKHQPTERSQIKYVMLPLHGSESGEEKNQLEAMQSIK